MTRVPYIRPLRALVLVRMIPVPLVTDAGLHMAPERLYSREGLLVAKGPEAHTDLPVGRACFIDGHAVPLWEDTGRRLAIFEGDAIAGEIERARSRPEALLCDACDDVIGLPCEGGCETARCDRCGLVAEVVHVSSLAPESAAEVQ